MNYKELMRRVVNLKSIFRLSTKKVEAKLLSSDTYTLAEKRRILGEVNEELKRLSTKSDAWFDKNLEMAYKDGSVDVYGYLEKLGVKSVKYTDYDWQTIQTLAGGSKSIVNEAISGVGRSASNILHKTTKAKLQAIISEGRVEKSTLREIKGMLVNYIDKNGVFLLDSRRRQWKPESYAEMFARTEMVNSYNQGVTNQMLHRGMDLAYITSYPTCECDICLAWEGEIVSLTGKTEGYPTLDGAYADGVFHPNCRHRVRPYYAPLKEQYDEKGKIFSTAGKVLPSISQI